MDEEMKARVDNYLSLLNEIRAAVTDEATAARILTEVAKDVRMAKRDEQRRNGRSNGATPRQVGWLRMRGIAAPAGLTKQQASAVIDAEQARIAQEADDRSDETPSGVTPRA